MIIGLLAGTFDPPHLGHLEMAKVALKSGEVDAVWFLPCWEHAFGKKPVDYVHRLSMCQLMVKDEDFIYVSMDEYIAKSKYTVDALEFITKNNPDKTFRLILGTDNFWNLGEWEASAKVMALAFPLWIRRSDTPNIPAESLFCDCDISSTQIRLSIKSSRIRREWRINKILKQKVTKYILEHKLYR